MPTKPLARLTATGRRDLALRASIVLAVLVLAACGSGPTASPVASGSSGPTASDQGTPGPSASEPAGSPTEPGASATPVETPVVTPSGSSAPSPSASGGAAAGCTGNAENRDFYVALAEAVAWDVYCPALPTGWFVSTGSFRLSGGGRLDISYKGPGGTKLDIREGAFCAGVDTCLPSGGDPGSASFGARSGRLVDLGGGQWAVIAQDGELAWEVTGTGLDAATLTSFAAAFILVNL